jgi:valyl-tRNA synthetase
MMPFITEYLWQNLPESVKDGPALIVAKWPVVAEELMQDQAEQDFSIVRELIKEIRRVRDDFHFPPGNRIALYIDASDKSEIIEQAKPDIESLAKIDPDQFYTDGSVEPSGQTGHLVVHGMNVRISLGDIDTQAELDRIDAEIAKLEMATEKIEQKLNSPFSERAPPDVVQAEREKLDLLKEKKDKLEEQRGFLA